VKKQNLPPEFLERLAAVKKKRARTVIDHILKYGSITTDDLKTRYGYDHPPRAIRDVKDEGIPLEKFSVKSPTTNRVIAAYRFGDPSDLRRDRVGGRVAFPRDFKPRLVEVYGSKCNICSGDFEGRYLQIDHRVPYEVGGDLTGKERELIDYQLLDGSCNRAKSWSCEHCRNWNEVKDPEICNTCYWARPESYRHVAMRNVRRLDVIWEEDEVELYDEVQRQAKSSDVPMPDFVKAILKENLED